MEKSRFNFRLDLLKRVKKLNYQAVTKVLIAVVICCASSVAAYGQASGRVITGKVTDSGNEALPGVNVVVKGTLRGSITDIEGNYSIEASSDDLIEFSFVGFENQELAVGSQNLINVTMIETIRDIDEVIVIGYGVQRKSVVTAAISSVDAEDLQRGSIGRVEHAIQGKTAGISVLPVSGSPGAGVKVRVRGTGSNGKSDPLYIVDGMKTSSINDLNPNDISSMEILKDAASAAIYGTEGANGVVLITTKSGQKGEAKVNYDFAYGIQNLATNMELMNAAEYKQFMKEAGLTVNSSEGYDTDWLSEISESAPMQRHNLSVSGGGEKTTYMVAGSYLKQDGAIGGSNAAYERYTFRVNTKSDVKSWLEIGNNLSFAHSNRQILPEDDEYRSVVNSALLMDPFTPVLEKGITPAIQEELDKGTVMLTNPAGRYYALSRNVSGETANPVAFIENTNNEEISDKLLASFYGTVKPFEGFSLTSRIGMELNYVTRNSWSPKYYFSVERSNQVNIVEDWVDKYSNVLWENFASYNKKIGEHEFTGLLGMSYEDFQHPNYYLKSQMPKEGDAFAYHQYSVNKETNRVGGEWEELTKISYFGRLSYNLKNRYMLEATLRRDGASVLPEGNQWGNFPSLSAGWNISEEGFWNIDAIDMLKLRASWGKNGSILNVIPFSDREFWVSTGIMYPAEDESLSQGVRIEKPINPDLGWEKSEQTNIGLDFYALRSRLSFSFDYYKKVTEGLLTLDSPVLSTGYYGVPSINGGNVENSGLEFALGYSDKTAGGLKYSVNVNLSTLKNEVTDLVNDTPIQGAALRGYNLTWFEEGKPLWYFRGYKTEGINPANGEIIVADVSGDGEITAADITEIGDPHPDLLYGASLSLEYKNFDFNLFMQGIQGNDVFMGWYRSDRPLSNKPRYFYTDRWTTAGQGASMPKPDNESDYLYRSDLMIGDGSYLRIKQIQLGYSLPRNVVNVVGLERTRIYVSLDDYFTFTKYEGMDPEAGSNDDNRLGIDRGLYPLTKKVMFGINVTF
ncbi:MAG TPA: TonB-dependent receptor [Marinilabiliaceae bacterium]|nr:TonB-dependent receptor [Marinilabiliaceae bacterium]